MALPKKIIPTLPLVEPKFGPARRQELLDKINEDGTYLPKSILHADLDRGFLDFVKDELQIISEGKIVPTLDLIITTQNWAQFTQTWDTQDLDKNVSLPFVTVVRVPEVQFGQTYGGMFNIPNRRQYQYVAVPTWDGTRKGVDVYSIPQPVPIDITYNVYIICNRMREVNSFNKVIIEKFASRQAYTVIKGHYIPILRGDIVDESVMDVEKRKFYLQKYSFTLQGFLLDENEFQVKPAISRQFTMFELDGKKPNQKRKKYPDNPETFETTINFNSSYTSDTRTIQYKVNMSVNDSSNISSYSTYINNVLITGSILEINSGDVLRTDVVLTDSGQNGFIVYKTVLV